LIAPKLFPAIFISVRKNPGVQTFGRNFFFIFQISIQKFLQFSTFAPKIFWQKEFRGQKKYGFPDAMACVPENGLRR